MKTIPTNLNDLIKLATLEPGECNPNAGDTKCVPIGTWIRMTKKEQIELLENIENEIGKFKVDHYRLFSPFVNIQGKRYRIFLYFHIYDENFDPKSLDNVVDCIYEIQVNTLPPETVI